MASEIDHSTCADRMVMCEWCTPGHSQLALGEGGCILRHPVQQQFP